VLETAVVALMALAWWAPTFFGLTDLQGRRGVPRVYVWKWTAILCLPVVGALLYRSRGRRELDSLAP
jgi:hypothetical protein